MNAIAAVAGLRARARRRVVYDGVLVALPVACALAALAWRLAGGTAALAVALAALLAAGATIAWRARRFDRGWLLSRLDAVRRDLEDSSGLLFADDARLGPLQRLQRRRIAQRIEAGALPDLRPDWSLRALAVAWLAAAALGAGALCWPARQDAVRASPAAGESAPAAAGESRLSSASLQVRPPDYTGLDATASQGLDATAPEGSLLTWELRYAPQPDAVAIVFHDGERLPLHRDGDAWTARHVLRASALYRVLAEGASGTGTARPHRLDAIPDQAPRVRVLAPERGLTLLAPGQREWLLRFEAGDDHGVASRARLRLTRTEGSGENVRFHEHERVLEGRGDRRTKRFEVRLLPSDFGLQRGEDLVARLEVLDNRAPQPQQGRSASVILRWPAEPVVGAEGLDLLARQVLPAYFRSQRQIIIDAEALLEARPRLAAADFERRSDTIGVDQRLLRLRYGQFLGEESEGGRALPTSDLATADADHDGTRAEDGPHDHDHGPGATPDPAPAGFGDVGDVLEAFGHTHDIAEAATLLDPETRELLRGALREMWQSELHLRQAAPAQALPYARRALALIKQVQQADRIYLQRVGTQLPPIDETRRLTGDRGGLGSRPLPPSAVARGDGALVAAWRALDPAAGADGADGGLDGLQAWLDGNRGRVSDPLAWIAALDAVRQDPGCAPCRDELRALLWGSLARPAGGIPRRPGADPGAGRYLDALQAQGGRP